MLPSVYKWQRCVSCDFVFANASACQSDFDIYYAEQSKYGSRGESGSGLLPSDNVRLRLQAQRINGFISSKTDSVLDVGSGQGGLLCELEKLDVRNLHAIDPDVNCVSLMNEKGFTSYVGGLGNTSEILKHGAFDFLVFSHVLEHLWDLSLLDDFIESTLSYNGKLYVEVPDIERYSCDGWAPFYFFDAEHVNHFSEFSLSLLAKRVGMVVESSGKSEINLECGLDYPVLWQCWGRNSKVENEIQKTVVFNVSEYIKRSNFAVEQHKSKVRKWRDDGREILIWGVGSNLQRMVSQFSLLECNIIACLDRDVKKQGRKINGIDVLSPSAGLDMYPDAYVLLCVATGAERLADELVSMGRVPLIPY